MPKNSFTFIYIIFFRELSKLNYYLGSRDYDFELILQQLNDLSSLSIIYIYISKERKTVNYLNYTVIFITFNAIRKKWKGFL